VSDSAIQVVVDAESENVDVGEGDSLPSLALVRSGGERRPAGRAACRRCALDV
jgi:hypothetical protein